MSRFKRYHPSWNLKFNNLGIFQSLKLRILMEKIFPISLKLSFSPNTLGGRVGLTWQCSDTFLIASISNNLFKKGLFTAVCRQHSINWVQNRSSEVGKFTLFWGALSILRKNKTSFSTNSVRQQGLLPS